MSDTTIVPPLDPGSSTNPTDSNAQDPNATGPNAGTDTNTGTPTANPNAVVDQNGVNSGNVGGGVDQNAGTIGLPQTTGPANILPR